MIARVPSLLFGLTLLTAGFAAPPPAAAPATGEQFLFDDLTYGSVGDLETHGWVVRAGLGWPGIEHAAWRRQNVTFVADSDRPGNRFLRMTSSTDGTPAGTFQTQICQQRKFKEGTYAARVRFARGPAAGPAGDGVVQSFYTYSTVDVPKNPNYSECDFEYLPGGGWGQTGPALFVTSWATTEKLPDGKWDNTSNALPGKQSGWHVLVLQVFGGHVRYFLDGTPIGDHSGRCYPREPMSLNFNLWFTQEGVAPSRETRSYEEDIDWVYFEKEAVVSPDEVVRKVTALRKAGIARHDTVPSLGLPCPCNN